MEERSLHSASSIDEVIEVYKSTVYGIALTRTRNSQDADDIFQDDTTKSLLKMIALPFKTVSSQQTMDKG